MNINCPRCGSDKVWGDGERNSKKRYECQDCKKCFSVGIEDDDSASSVDPSHSSSGSYEENDSSIHIVCASTRILSEQEIIEQFKVDTEKWEIQSFQVKTTEGYRKDRTLDWHVENGITVRGDSVDSGKMLVVPLFHIKATFRRKTEEIRTKLVIEDFKADAKAYAPKYDKIKYPSYAEGMMYEIAFPDLHFGRLTWNEESGDDYDIKIAAEMLHRVVDDLLGFVQNYSVSKILLPLGNDYFNVDNKNDTTAHGTPQQEDTRWKKTYRKGRQLLVDVIDRCSQVAPVDVLVIPGNHDEQKMFYVGDSLECWYHSSPNVRIDNSAKNRKYYLFGTNLIGFAHGYWEKLNKLPYIMAQEVPELWAKSTIHEWHTGDKHARQDFIVSADERSSGMMIRVLRSLAGRDAWTYDNAFIGAVRAAEAFLWHPQRGLMAQFTSMAADTNEEIQNQKMQKL